MRTFNCGVGMIIVVAPSQAAEARSVLEAQRVAAWELGVITDQAMGVHFD